MRAGLVTRMAVLYDLLTTGPVGVKTESLHGGGVMLFAKAAPSENLVVRGARVARPGRRASTPCSTSGSTTA